MTSLSLYFVTFNCGRALVEPDALGKHLLDGWEPLPTARGSFPDVIVLNLQEVAPLSYAFLGDNYVKPYFNRFRQTVRVATSLRPGEDTNANPDYSNVLARNCGLTAIMLFVREDLVDDIGLLNLAEVGVGEMELSNKGAIGVRVGWKVPNTNKHMFTTFVSAHLAPFEAEVERRDQDYVDIVKGLVFSKKDAREWRTTQQGAEDVPLLAGESTDEEGDDALRGMYSNDSYLFFSGDLNYRTALTSPGRQDFQHYPQPTSDVKSASHYQHLLEKDQLSQQLQKRKTLHGLSEQTIDFAPTYKYETNADRPITRDEEVDEWAWAQHRWPSWCDRILFSSSKVQAGKYSSLPIFRTSDHRPVALSASIPIQTIFDSHFAAQAPASIDRHYKSRRAAARRKEIIIGLAAYLGLTWEGNALLLGTLLIAFGGIYVSKSMI